MTRRHRPLALLSAVAVLAASLAAPARAASPIGGEHDPPKTAADDLMLGFPEITWQHSFPTNGTATHAIRAGLLVWPLSAHVGYVHRRVARRWDKVTLSGVVGPLLYVGFFGGARAFYADTRWGRSRSFLFSLGPGIDLGVQASVHAAPKLDVTVGWSNPVVFWMFLSQGFQWYVEWPIALSGGIEYRASEAATVFARLGAGPSVVISGATQQVGLYFSALVGVHLAD
ncbi:porin [Myxococcota bacterium]|nr:porin [Myxococcota bacterium]